MGAQVTGFLLLLLACVGNAEWWVMLVNRRHSLRYRHLQLLRIRMMHDVGILCFPVFIFASAGLRSQGLLRGGTFFDLPWMLQTILVITIVGTIPLIYCAVRHWTYRPPASLRSMSSEITDCLPDQNDENRNAVVGDRSSLFLKMPWNQIFLLETNRKHIDLSHVQRAGSTTPPNRSLRLAHFSDVHLIGTPGPGFHKIVTEKLCELQPDAFMFTGDLLDRPELLPVALEMFTALQKVAPGYFVLGNHDWHLDHEDIRQQLEALGWESVADRSCEVNLAGWATLIAGSEAPWIGGNPQVAAAGTEDLRLLLSHSPDQRNYAVDNDFDVMLCGHNHGGQVVLPLLGPVYSPSIYGVKYAGGLFRHRDTLLHVSRGVGAKDLLRWNCPPEITLLEFENARVNS